MKLYHLFSLLLLAYLTACGTAPQDSKPSQAKESNPYAPKPYVELRHPEWSKNATIYEVNIRQYTPEGTFKAFETHLPRLKAMGVDILWLMPINPIGKEKRKGKMGSYYSIQDYYGVNPEFGTLEELKALVKKIHSMGMYVIIDWVANHSSWDNKLAKEHPDWYTKTPEGSYQPTPWYDWDDVIDFDYDKEGIRKYMTEVLKYWVKEADIDGYRCDVAGFIPVDFWDNVRRELEQIKPVFMLAEWESRDMHKNAFDMTYAWTLWEKMHDAASGKKSIAGLVEYMAHDVGAFPKDGYRMVFTDNHDMNSWNGNQYKNFGEGLEASMVLCSVINGMPLVYSGQEAGLDRSLAFFEKDSIVWKKHRNEEIYTKLFELKHKNKALWNGAWGGEMVRIYSDKMEQVLSFMREKDGNRIVPIINYSNQPAKVALKTKYQVGKYKDWFSGKEQELKENTELELKAWEYLILVKQ